MGAVFSRTWIAVLAGSFVLWGMSRLGGVSVSEPGGDVPSGLTSGSLAAAAEAVPALAACLEDVAALDRDAPADAEALSIAGRYGRWCRSLLDAEAFDAFVAVYGERSRMAVLAILEREERLAAELAADPPGVVLDPDVIWAAALSRAASDVRFFEAELSAWFDAWSPPGGDGAGVSAGNVAAVGW